MHITSGVVGSSCDIFIYVYISVCQILTPSPRGDVCGFALSAEWVLVGNRMKQLDENARGRGGWWSRRTINCLHCAMNPTHDGHVVVNCVTIALLRPLI